ncbi:FAD-dependent oxidoreductase [Streptomyces sp. NPDC054975]
MTPARQRVGDHAVVLGGSMSGLFAARVLSDAYEKVTVVERDELTGDRGVRRGVPQGRHLHALQARGQQVIEELFPGISDEMIAAGAATGDVGFNTRWYFNGKRPQRVRTGLRAVAASRPFLERHVHERVATLPNVVFRSGHDILGLETTPDHARVTGVRVQAHGGGTAEETIGADLVVDATGRGSRVPAWLEEFGFPRVEESRLKVGVGYTTCRYRLTSDPYDDEISIAVIASAGLPRGAIMTKVEDDLVTLTAYGILGDHPPTDREGFRVFLKSLAVPDIYEAVQDQEPLEDPVAFKYPVSVRRHFERVTRFPQGLLATGDSVCSFNPTYAQGMTVASLGALVLREHLAAGSAPVAAEYFRDVAHRAVDGPWEAMTINDLAFPGVEGRRTLSTRMAHALTSRVQAASTRDSAVTEAFLRVVGLIDPPSTLMRPAMLTRILRGSRAAS